MATKTLKLTVTIFLDVFVLLYILQKKTILDLESSKKMNLQKWY